MRAVFQNLQIANDPSANGHTAVIEAFARGENCDAGMNAGLRAIENCDADVKFKIRDAVKLKTGLNEESRKHETPFAALKPGSRTPEFSKASLFFEIAPARLGHEALFEGFAALGILIVRLQAGSAFVENREAGVNVRSRTDAKKDAE